jgi:Tfp pilus assembly protein PilN
MRPVNLLPPDQRPHAGGGRPGSAYALLGALAILFVAALAYVLTVQDIGSKQDELAEVQAETQVAQQRAAALAPYAQFASMRQTRVDSVTALAQARIDWERLMRELARVLPAGSYVSSVDATGAPAAADPAGGAGAGPKLKLVGCARGHRDVATVLVRLRKLYRADDVKLRESSRAGGACLRGTGFTAEVTFTPLPTTSEAPRGRERVPASLGGGS